MFVFVVLIVTPAPTFTTPGEVAVIVPASVLPAPVMVSVPVGTVPVIDTTAPGTVTAPCRPALAPITIPAPLLLVSEDVAAVIEAVPIVRVAAVVVVTATVAVAPHAKAGKFRPCAGQCESRGAGRRRTICKGSLNWRRTKNVRDERTHTDGAGRSNGRHTVNSALIQSVRTRTSQCVRCDRDTCTNRHCTGTDRGQYTTATERQCRARDTESGGGGHTRSDRMSGGSTTRQQTAHRTACNHCRDAGAGGQNRGRSRHRRSAESQRITTHTRHRQSTGPREAGNREWRRGLHRNYCWLMSRRDHLQRKRQT